MGHRLWPIDYGPFTMARLWVISYYSNNANDTYIPKNVQAAAFFTKLPCGASEIAEHIKQNEINDQKLINEFDQKSNEFRFIFFGNSTDGVFFGNSVFCVIRYYRLRPWSLVFVLSGRLTKLPMLVFTIFLSVWSYLLFALSDRPQLTWTCLSQI